ncbi:MAG: FHIPEP family type III secretion protein, partial [Candidatus Thiodiazotropha sp.]
FTSPKALAVAAAVLFLMGIIPGMPNFAFLTLAAAAGGVAWMIWQRQQQPEEPMLEPEPQEMPEQQDLGWEDVQPVDLIGLEVGYRLIPLVDRNQGGQLMNRIKGVRRKLSQELGFLIPSVHIRDNLDLSPNNYRISINGVAMAQAEIFPDRELAINPGQVFGELEGVATKDPTFGLDAVWVEPAQKDHAQTLGYTVVDASTVVATHLSEILQNQASELLGHEEAQQLFDMLARSAPKLVEDLIPNTLPMSVVVKILQNLLAEHVPIRDIRRIAETLAAQAPRSQDPGVLTAAVRVALSRGIVQQLTGTTEEIPVAVLDANLEQILQQAMQSSDEGQAGFEPGLAERLQSALAETQAAMEAQGHEGILLVAAPIRPWMSRFAKHAAPGMHVLSYNEIPDNRQIKVVSTIGNATVESRQEG